MTAPRTVVLLPGIGGVAAHDFVFLEPMLARHHRVVSVDLAAPPEERTTFDDLVARVEARLSLLDDGAADEVVLVGYSLGAQVAAAVAARAADSGGRPSIAAVVLVSGWLGNSERLRLFAAGRRALTVVAPAAVAELDRFAMLSAAFLESRGTAEVRQARPLGPASASQSQVLLDLSSGSNLEAMAARITQPTLVVGSAEDALVGRDQSRALFAAIPTARYTELDTGHASLIERPAQVLSLIERFLLQPTEFPAGTMIAEPRV